MTISEEIKSNKFQSELHKAHINVLFTGNWLNAQVAQRLKQFDLSPEQFNVLRILRGAHPSKRCLKEITERMLDKNSNTSRIVKKLEDKQLIQINGHETDKRFYQIGITKKGLDVLAKLDVELDQSAPIKSILNDKEAKQLNELLDKLRG